MSETLDLATLGTGAVVAPAGHGKTYSIARTVASHPDLRILVLTHTNAAVAALKRHIGSQGGGRVRIDTIAAFCLKLVRSFPGRAEWHESEQLDLSSLQPAALRALSCATILEVVAMGFDLLIVDEYQDCSADQARAVDLLSDVMPTIVLGDPLQAIFDFGSAPADPWSGSSNALPHLGTLSVPHRWKRTNPSLGEWILHARQELLAGRRPSSTGPHPVELESLDRDAAQGGLSRLIPRNGTTAIISPDPSNPNALSSIARSYKGRVRVAEKSDLAEVRVIARTLDQTSDRAAVLVALIGFASKIRTKVASSVVQTLSKNLKAKGAASTSKHPVVLAARKYLTDGSTDALLEYFRHLTSAPDGHTYRPQLHQLWIRILSMSLADSGPSFEEHAIALIERSNHRTSWEPFGTVVGTTLRLKGLEFDNVIILDPHTIRARNHLYVALSRPTKRLIIARTQ
ncbi:UvrD-helicase domain-containing protein [Arthrobacter sp. NPDC056493]|uniref:UvrD-helicase domain-containing protein n=1 Tax=Arthrobacter sp. NPDC056493 TaxID=3345839 RepID=UPI003672DD9A